MCRSLLSDEPTGQKSVQQSICLAAESVVFYTYVWHGSRWSLRPSSRITHNNSRGNYLIYLYEHNSTHWHYLTNNWRGYYLTQWLTKVIVQSDQSLSDQRSYSIKESYSTIPGYDETWPSPVYATFIKWVFTKQVTT